nr:hypothetical protein [Methylobacterium sp. ZNC0032]
MSAFANSLPPPIIYHSGIQHWGFRFTKPDVPHFCLLKAVRSISGLNAISELIRTGYVQEIVVILRTIVECLSHIDFVLIDAKGCGNKEIRKYVESYFQDYRRNDAADFKKPKMRQAAVHKAIGDVLNQSMIALGRGDEFGKVSASQLMSNVYLNYSNYVHARYPEVMDLYGGSPSSFHLRGMSGTPKDIENFEMFEASIESVSLCFKRICIELKLNKLVESDAKLIKWFKEI